MQAAENAGLAVETLNRVRSIVERSSPSASFVVGVLGRGLGLE
jgi:hypothetical protein